MRAALVLLAALLLLDLRAANRLFEEGDYEGAVREYRELLADDPASAVVNYNLGTALLRLERYDEARQHLRTAARVAEMPLRAMAYYNLGNADLEPAFRARDGGGAREERLRRAIVAYKRALLLDADDLDAKWNLELARRLLARRPERPDPRRDDAGAGGSGGGGAGGGGGGDARRGRDDPAPQSVGDSGPRPDLSPAEAERILAAAERRELQVQRRELRKEQTRSRVGH